MIHFYGWAGAVEQGVRFLNAKLRRRSIGALARWHGVPLMATGSVNDPAYLDRIRALRPDVIISVAGGEIFCPELLSLPSLGCVNIHSGRLPKYRGMLPTFWQMLNDEPEVVITVHRMVQRLDAGDVLATAPFPIRRFDSLDRVIRGTKRAGAQLFIRVLRELRAGRARPVPLDMTQAAYFRFPAPDDVRAFRRRGHRLL
jgi:methionyl-tRNA formyltransferase